jgi:hypothetical protein
MIAQSAAAPGAVIYDALGFYTASDNALAQVETMCQFADQASVLKALAPIAGLGAAVSGVATASRTYWDQKWLEKGGTPAVPLAPTAPAMAALHLAFEDFIDFADSAEKAAGGDDLTSIAAPPLCKFVRLVMQALNADALTKAADAGLDPAIGGHLVSAMLAVAGAKAPGSRGGSLDARTPPVPSARLQRTIGGLRAQSQALVRTLILPAIDQAERRDAAVRDLVLSGLAFIDDDGSIIAGQRHDQRSIGLES